MQNQASTEKKDKGVWDLIADIILVVYILLIFFSNALNFWALNYSMSGIMDQQNMSKVFFGFFPI